MSGISSGPNAPDDPGELLLTHLSGAWTTQTIYVAAELGLADALASGPRRCADLALELNADEAALRRLLRGLDNLSVVRTEPEDRFSLTPVGERLGSNHPSSLRSWARWWGRSLWPAWGQLLHSVRTGESGRSHLDGTRGFDHLVADGEAAAVFYRATIELTRRSASAILDAADFSRFSTVVDIGGGQGELLVRILEAIPQSTGILFEIPAAVPGARAYLAEQGLSERCTVVAGDFFSEIPAGGDAYLLKSILHDWRDDAARRILENCRRAMRTGAHLLVLEHLLPEAGGPTNPAPSPADVVADLTMLVAHGAGERTGTQLQRLLDSADFHTVRVVTITPTLYLIEAVAGRGSA